MNKIAFKFLWISLLVPVLAFSDTIPSIISIYPAKNFFVMPEKTKQKQEKKKSDKKEQIRHPMGVLSQRLETESQITTNPFSLMAYHPNYVMPFYYTFSPYDAIYRNNLPDHQSLMHAEVKAQFSIKIPILPRAIQFVHLFFGYTQLSYWQAYENSAFFRETNYEPEFFVSRLFKDVGIGKWRLVFLNLGMMHQSNGRGGGLERSWNRVYTEFAIEHGNFSINWKPWYVFHDSQVRRYNPDIARYLGHSRLLFLYKFHNVVFSLMSRNNLESWFRRGAYQASISFPLDTHFRGYVQYFTGYGQSLVEYNHRTQSVGVGIALSDYL